MKTQVLLVVLGLSLFISSTSVFGHHSNSTYNVEQETTVQGEVTRVQWVNPHVFVYIDVISDSGETQSWAVEGVNPAGFIQVGWNRDTVKLGDTITVTGNPSKNMTSPGIFPNSIYFNERKLFDYAEFMAGQFEVEDASSAAASLAGTWDTPLTPSVFIPRESTGSYQPGTGLHELTAEGLLALEQFDELTMSPALNCIGIPAPHIMHYGDNKEIVIENDVVRIVSEHDSGERIIHLGETTHEGAIYSNQGHSIGTLIGNVLEIDTTHFTENAYGNGLGLTSSPEKHLIEKLTLSYTGRALIYQFTLTDPVYLQSPMTLETMWSYQPSKSVIVRECDLESAQRLLEN